jgi:hypothetical protein
MEILRLAMFCKHKIINKIKVLNNWQFSPVKSMQIFVNCFPFDEWTILCHEHHDIIDLILGYVLANGSRSVSDQFFSENPPFFIKTAC